MSDGALVPLDPADLVVAEQKYDEKLDFVVYLLKKNILQIYVTVLYPVGIRASILLVISGPRVLLLSYFGSEI